MRLQVVSDEETQAEDSNGVHESNGIALHEPEQEESLEAVATDGYDESTEPEPETAPTPDTDPTSEPAIDPASNPSDDGISPDEMPSREGAPTTMEEPVVGASRSDRWEQHVNEIREQDRAVAFAENEWNAAKEEAKNKKAAWEVAVSELREVIRRGPSQPSLFGQPSVESVAEKSVETVAETTPEETPEETTEPEQAPDDDSWKSTPIVELEILGLAKGIIGKLLDAGINTVGELAAWTTEYRTLADVKGLGPAKVEKVEQTMERFWAERTSAKEAQAS